MKLWHARYVALLACILHCASILSVAQKGKLLVVVQDLQQRPKSGVTIGIEGGGDSRTTGQDGKAILTLAGNTKENDWVSFQIIECPPGEDLVIVAPANHRHPVPSFDEKAENFVTVIVIPRDIYIALMASPKMRESTTKIQRVPQKRR